MSKKAQAPKKAPKKTPKKAKAAKNPEGYFVWTAEFVVVVLEVLLGLHLVKEDGAVENASWAPAVKSAASRLKVRKPPTANACRAYFSTGGGSTKKSNMALLAKVWPQFPVSALVKGIIFPSLMGDVIGMGADIFRKVLLTLWILKPNESLMGPLKDKLKISAELPGGYYLKTWSVASAVIAGVSGTDLANPGEVAKELRSEILSPSICIQFLANIFSNKARI